jgi:hypothetical protein
MELCETLATAVDGGGGTRKNFFGGNGRKEG